MADTVIENLITKLSFDFDGDKLEKFDEFLGSAVKGLTAVVAGAVAASTAIFLFTNKIAQANDQLSRLSQTYDVAIETMQEFDYVATLNKGSAESMNSAIGTLSKTMSEASRGIGAGVETFGMLGLSVTDATGKIKKTDDMILEIADSIAGLDNQAQRLEFAQKLGFGQDLLLTLQQGSEAIKQQRQEARELGFVFGQDGAKAAERFSDSLLKIQMIIKGISTLIATKFMKHFVPMWELYIEWYKINKDLIKQNILAWFDKGVTVFRIISSVLNRVVGMVLSLTKGLGGLKNTIIFVTGVLMAMNASALLMPILLAAAAVGLLLILEDIIKFAEGGDSAIGNLLQDFPVLNQMLTDFISLLKMAKEGWEGLFKSQTWDDVKFFFKDVVGKIGSIGAPDQPQIFRAPGLIPGAAGNTSNTKTNNVTININGGDTDKIRKDVADVLNEQYSAAETNLSSQVES